jgi:hypothetical protein
VILYLATKLDGTYILPVPSLDNGVELNALASYNDTIDVDNKYKEDNLVHSANALFPI